MLSSTISVASTQSHWPRQTEGLPIKSIKGVFIIYVTPEVGEFEGGL